MLKCLDTIITQKYQHKDATEDGNQMQKMEINCMFSLLFLELFADKRKDQTIFPSSAR